MGLKGNEPMSPPHPTLEVHIEQIVFHGYSPADTHRLGETVQAELSRLVQRLGIDHSAVNNLSIERLDGGSLKKTSQPQIEALGVKLAGSVHQLLAPSVANASPRVHAKPDGAKP